MKSSMIDWRKVEEDLDRDGYARMGNLLDAGECRALIDGFANDALYRRHIVMQLHGYGQGEYKYFTYPLPDLVAELRTEFYAPLASIANRWAERLSLPNRYPETLSEYTALCHDAGQLKPTPLILKYEPGDFNRLHQDLYGEHLFPMQMVFLLNEPGAEFDGGEFILTEQRARQQSRARVLPLSKGDAIVFPVNLRPIKGKNGYVRATMRHGVSDLRRGNRFTLGVIFHDAK